MYASIKHPIQELRGFILRHFFPTEWKEYNELEGWKGYFAGGRISNNQHFEALFTNHFSLTPAFFSGKRILDIGCGPHGSLEWASMASQRIGLDTLAVQYQDLGANQHEMQYVAAPAESIPFRDSSFDVVSSFNSLDHVADINETALEIIRVLRPGGTFLLLTELNHEATITEPQTFSWDIVQTFSPHFEILEERHYEKSIGMYESIRENLGFDHSAASERYGVLSVKFRKWRRPSDNRRLPPPA